MKDKLLLVKNLKPGQHGFTTLFMCPDDNINPEIALSKENVDLCIVRIEMTPQGLKRTVEPREEAE